MQSISDQVFWAQEGQILSLLFNKYKHVKSSMEDAYLVGSRPFFCRVDRVKSIFVKPERDSWSHSVADEGRGGAGAISDFHPLY